jgi:hypothetical protein
MAPVDILRKKHGIHGRCCRGEDRLQAADSEGEERLANQRARLSRYGTNPTDASSTHHLMKSALIALLAVVSSYTAAIAEENLSLARDKNWLVVKGSQIPGGEIRIQLPGGVLPPRFDLMQTG